MDLMKSFRLTIGRIQSAEINQSEKVRTIRKSNLIENNRTKKVTEITIQLKPGHYPENKKLNPSR